MLAREPVQGEPGGLTEEWRSVEGFEGVYEVSNLGRVRRIGRAARHGKGHGGGAILGRILKDSPYWKAGYRKVQLWRAGYWRNYGIHQLVARAFIGPCPPGKEINHKDGVKHHNIASNLEYVTRGENIAHAYAIGLRSGNGR